MKKNMVPLLGIAFIVAIISTGVFYGLFAGKLRSSNELPGHAIVVAARDLDRGTVLQPSDLRLSEIEGALAGSFSKPDDAAGATLLASMKANEPLLEERVTPRISEGQRAAGPVPTGMRAITLHIFQSESVLNMLRPGSRVDLQAVSDKNGGAELRTVLQNVQVLAVSAADGNGNRPAGAGVTVLIGAPDADMVALADAGSRIRLALRNPMDQEATPRHSLSLAALFSAGNKLPTDTEPAHSAHAAVWDHPVQLHVQVLSVSDSGLEQLRARSSEVASDNAWRVAAFRPSDDAKGFVRGLEQKHALEMVTGERLTAGIGRPIGYHAGPRPDSLGVQFSPAWLASNKLTLRVTPRIGASTGPEAQLAELSSFLIESRANDPAAEKLAARLFPGHSWEHKHLAVFVSVHAIGPTSAVALAGAHRGR